jgi:hypothetical protein
MIQDTVSGVLRSLAHARAILAELEAAGFHDADVLVLVPSEGLVVSEPPPRDRVPDGLAQLSPAGASVGGLLGLAAGIAAVVTTSVGPGPFELSSVGAAVATTTIGAALGAHVGTEVARAMRSARDRRRRLLVSVYTETPSRADAAKQILQTHAASEIAVDRAESIH